MKLKNKITLFFSTLVLALGIASCNTDVENLEIQKPYKYSDKYYENLRDYKKSDHAICFVWFSDYLSTHSPGVRFSGLPDSIDICSLWGGIPRPDLQPLVYEEMRFCQKVKGMKMTYVTFPGVSHLKWVMDKPENERIKVYGDSLLRIVYNNELDGMDLDYEIQGDWMHGANFVKLIEYLGQFIGPKGKDKTKMLIVDGWPIDGGYEYLTYFVAQAYQSSGAADLQNRFEQVYSKGLDPKRYIVTENIGDYYANGGTPFTEADGNNQSGLGGQLYSLEGMARWNPTQGRKGGFGSFYCHRDYNSNPPYKWLRYGIQCANPSVK